MNPFITSINTLLEEKLVRFYAFNKEVIVAINQLITHTIYYEICKR